MGAARNRRTLLFSHAAPGAGSRSSVIQGGSRAKNDIRKPPICEAIRGRLRNLLQSSTNSSHQTKYFSPPFHGIHQAKRPASLRYTLRGARDKKGIRGGWRSLRCGRHSRQPPMPSCRRTWKRTSGVLSGAKCPRARLLYVKTLWTAQNNMLGLPLIYGQILK